MLPYSAFSQLSWVACCMCKKGEKGVEMGKNTTTCAEPAKYILYWDTALKHSYPALHLDVSLPFLFFNVELDLRTKFHLANSEDLQLKSKIIFNVLTHWMVRPLRGRIAPCFSVHRPTNFGTSLITFLWVILQMPSWGLAMLWVYSWQIISNCWMHRHNTDQDGKKMVKNFT